MNEFIDTTISNGYWDSQFSESFLFNFSGEMSYGELPNLENSRFYGKVLNSLDFIT